MSGVRSGIAATLLADPSGVSLKRVAWAYGCAKKGSDEERMLLEVLLEKVDSTLTLRINSELADRNGGEP